MSEKKAYSKHIIKNTIMIMCIYFVKSLYMEKMRKQYGGIGKIPWKSLTILKKNRVRGKKNKHGQVT